MKNSFTVFVCTCLSILILSKSTTLSQDYALSFNGTNQDIVPATDKDVNYVNSELPAVSITVVDGVGWNWAQLSASITNLGVPNPTKHGFCWGTINSVATELGAVTSTGKFTGVVYVGSSQTSYTVRAYVTNDAGTSYGDEVQFTTSYHRADPPTVTCSDITVNSAKVTISTTQANLYDCWDGFHYPSYSASWYVDGTFVDTAAGSPILITGLQANTQYVVRGYTECWDTASNPYHYGVSSFKTLSELPVEIISFTAAKENKNVVLHWQTATEVNNYGFSVERCALSTLPYAEGKTQSIEGKVWTKLGFVIGSGNSNSPKSYSFEDKNPPCGKLQYRLKQIDFDGSFEYKDEIEITIDLPTQFSLEQNFPNPFNPLTTIEFQIPNASNVKIEVLDILGRTLETLLNKDYQAGNHRIEFDASKFSSDVYFYKITAGDFVQVKKMILLK